MRGLDVDVGSECNVCVCCEVVMFLFTLRGAAVWFRDFLFLLFLLFFLFSSSKERHGREGW